MILDSRNEFADATALSTAATGLALVGNVIDLGETRAMSTTVAAGGYGITAQIANEFFAAGTDVITLGNHAWDQRELIAQFGLGMPRPVR